MVDKKVWGRRWGVGEVRVQGVVRCWRCVVSGVF